MSSLREATDRTADSPGQTAEGDTNDVVGDILAGIDACLRRWKAARHDGQAVLARLSNALLLRTYVDEARGGSVSGNISGDISGGGAHVWGALASAGTSVSRVALATEARVRRLHGDLSALQDAMVAAAAGVRRHAQEARHQCKPFSAGEDAALDVCAAPSSTPAGGKRGIKAASTTGLTILVGGGYAMEDVANAASEVSEMLLQEALVTATVARGVGECQDDRNALTVYAAAWMMQPYLDARRLRELEVMVEARRRN